MSREAERELSEVIGGLCLLNHLLACQAMQVNDAWTEQPLGHIDEAAEQLEMAQNLIESTQGSLSAIIAKLRKVKV